MGASCMNRQVEISPEEGEIATRNQIQASDPRQPARGGIRTVLLDLNTQLGEQKKLLKRLNLEIASLESNPVDAQRQEALNEIRKDYKTYGKLMHELQNMHIGTSTHFDSLMRRGEDQNKESIEEQKGGSEAPETSKKLQTLMRKTVVDYLRDGLVLKLDTILQDRPAMTVTELARSADVLVTGLKLNTKAIARVTSSSRKFIPTKMIALSVIIEDFSELRKLRDFAKFKNLKMLRYDRVKFQAGLRCIGITDVRLLTNPSWDQFKDTINNLVKECKQNHEAGERTFVLFQFGGHGIQDNFTFALCSTIDRKKIAFPIEQKVRILSEVQSTYVVALFDCCREKMTVAEVQKGKKIQVEGRGGGFAFEEDEEEQNFSVEKARDLMIVFGCPPNQYTPADSPLTVDWHNVLNEMSDKVEKVLTLPGDSTAWKPCDKGEVLNFTTHDCVLPFAGEKNPLCLKQHTYMKLNSRVQHLAATSIVALRQKVFTKVEKIFYNSQEYSIVAISPVTTRMRMLQPYDKLIRKNFSTCQIELGLFQIYEKGSCHVLLPDQQARKFTVEERRPLPYKESWTNLVCLPGSKVLVFGPKWDQYNLTPWVYDLKEDTWSNKLTPDGESLPPLPKEASAGTTLFLSNKVHYFKGNEVLTLDLKTFEWKVIRLAQSSGNYPLIVPFSSTEIAIVGGNDQEPHNRISIYDPQSEQAKKLSAQANEDGVLTHQDVVVISGKQAFSVTYNKYRSCRMTEITLKDECVEYKTLRPLAAAENRAKFTSEVHPNLMLRAVGLKELTNPQLEAFESLWSSFMDIWTRAASKDDILYWFFVAGRGASLKSYCFKHDNMTLKLKPLDKTQQELFFQKAWNRALSLYGRSYPEPQDLRNARIKAIRSLDPASGDQITWNDIKRCFTILDTWLNEGRANYTIEAREIEKLEQK